MDKGHRSGSSQVDGHTTCTQVVRPSSRYLKKLASPKQTSVRQVVGIAHHRAGTELFVGHGTFVQLGTIPTLGDPPGLGAAVAPAEAHIASDGDGRVPVVGHEVAVQPTLITAPGRGELLKFAQSERPVGVHGQDDEVLVGQETRSNVGPRPVFEAGEEGDDECVLQDGSTGGFHGSNLPQ